MNVLMIGVDKTSVGGMLTVIENYLNSKKFCNDVNLHYIATVIRANKLKKITTFISKIPEIIKTIKGENIDIVHVHMAERGSVFREGFVILLAKRLGCKTVIHMHGATIEDWYYCQNRIVHKITRHIFCTADKMVVLGELWRPFMSKVMNGHEENISVLHNAVKMPAENSYHSDAHNFLFYGMLIQRKGIDDLLEAYKLILNDIPQNVNLDLYGDDYDSEEKIRDKIKRFGLGGRAIYKGWLTADNREEAFKDAIVNILPSYNEGLPMTILETMGYGIPNISTRIAAIPEAIDDNDNGFLINAGDVQDLANKMTIVANDPQLRKRLSNAAYKKAKQEFSLESHFEQIKQIYASLGY